MQYPIYVTRPPRQPIDRAPRRRQRIGDTAQVRHQHGRMSVKRGFLAWLPPALLAASAAAANGALVMGVLLPGSGRAQDLPVYSAFTTGFGVAALALLVAGVVLAMRWAGTDE